MESIKNKEETTMAYKAQGSVRIEGSKNKALSIAMERATKQLQRDRLGRNTALRWQWMDESRNLTRWIAKGYVLLVQETPEEIRWGLRQMSEQELEKWK